VSQRTHTGERTHFEYHPHTSIPLTQHTRHDPDSGDGSGAVDSAFYAIVTDLIGTPVELIDPDTADPVGRADSDLWGRTTWRGAGTPLRFPGQYHDGETGLHYNFARYYNPGTGRYLTTDPLGLVAAPNPHTYPSNPTCVADPLGLSPTGCPKTCEELDARPFRKMWPEGPLRRKMFTDPVGSPDVVVGHFRPGNDGHNPPRVSITIPINASGL
jgi:RHS repeat-associated protein